METAGNERERRYARASPHGPGRGQGREGAVRHVLLENPLFLPSPGPSPSSGCTPKSFVTGRGRVQRVRYRVARVPLPGDGRIADQCVASFSIV